MQVRNCWYTAARECAIKGDFYDPIFFDNVLEDDCRLMKTNGRKYVFERICKVLRKKITEEQEAYAKEYMQILTEIRLDQ
jgi:hypothetical protein